VSECVCCCQTCCSLFCPTYARRSSPWMDSIVLLSLFFDVCGHCFFAVAFSPIPFIFCSYSRCNESRSKAVVVPTRVRMSGPWSVCRHVSREEERMDAYSLLPLLFCVFQIFVIANLCALSRERGKGKEGRPCTNKLRVCSVLWRGVEEVWGMMNEQEIR